MKRVELHPEAHADLTETVDFMRNDVPVWEASSSKVIAAQEPLFSNFHRPERFITTTKIFSEWHYGFSIFNIFLDLEDKIFIISIIHDRQRPDFWLNRLS